MDEWINDPKLHSALVAILVAAGGWFVRREVKRIDEGLADAVKRSEFEQMRADLRQEHRENTGRLERIEKAIDNGITGTHRRIDDLYKELINK
jgi:hypothetical protein